MTAGDIIRFSLKKLGVLAGNDTPSGNEASDALTTLNNLIDTWNTQDLMMYSTTAETFATTAGKQTYTVGTSGSPDWNTTRPNEIQNLVWQQVQGSTTFQQQIELISQDQWAALTVPSVTSNIATKCWVQYTYPNLTLNFWPIPAIVNNVYMISWKSLSSLTLQTTISLPPGYANALIYNLAVYLAPDYGVAPRPDIVEMAAGMKAEIKAINQKFLLLKQDVGIVAKKPGFNWLTGE